MIAKSKIAKLRKFINGPENEVFLRCMTVSWGAVVAIAFIAPAGPVQHEWLAFFCGIFVALAACHSFIRNPEPL